MGCLNSTPVQGYGRARRATATKSPVEEKHAPPPETPEEVYKRVTEGVNVIYVPSNMTPIVCLTKTTIPIVTTLLHLEDSTPTEIRLPIIAASIFGAGFVMCMCQVDFWTAGAMKSGDTRRLLSNILKLLAGQRDGPVVLGAGIEENTVKEQIRGLGYECLVASDSMRLRDVSVLMIPSDSTFSSVEELTEIVNFVHNGGGLLVVYVHKEEEQSDHSVNDLLTEFGLAFPMCLLNANLESAQAANVLPDFSTVSDANFDCMIKEFAAQLQERVIDMSKLDDCVTSLRYYIMVCGPAQNDDMKRIVSSCWEFLNRTKYVTEAGVCGDLSQAIVLVLVQDLYSRLPIEEIPKIPEHEKFPGKTGESVVLSDFEMPFRIGADEWISTGLWLPASVSSTVTVEGDCPDFEIQIGCHKESLLSAQRPWPRWPSIVSVSPMSGEYEVTVGSPFGGIVYVTRDSEGEELIEQSVVIKFKRFAQYPRYIHDKPEVWEKTKDFDVPWAELDMESIIFSLPSKDARRITDFNLIKKVYGTIVSEIVKYTSMRFVRPFRVVYDVDLPEPLPPAMYPVVSYMKEIDGTLIDIAQPNAHLFNLAVLITISAIKENCFDALFTHLLAELAAAVALREVYPEFDPLHFPGITLSKGFVEFWEIQTGAGRTVIPNTLAIFQDPNYEPSEVPDDMWIAFVKELCKKGRYNFTKLLEDVRPLPISVSWSANELATFIGHRES